MAVSHDRLVVTNNSGGWQSALAEPAFDSAGRAYAEWILEATDENCHVFLGLTALGAAASGCGMYMSPQSRMYYCSNSSVYPTGTASPSWMGSGRRSVGDRVGLLVKGGRVGVYVNGELFGGGPMAEGLPGPRLRFAVAMYCQNSRVRLVAGARPPAT